MAIAVFLAVPVTAVSAYAFAAVMGLLWLGTVPLTRGVVAQISGVPGEKSNFVIGATREQAASRLHRPR